METRTAVYDRHLRLEAYHFEGMDQEFPNHFHPYYVVGLIEQGERLLRVDEKDYAIRPGDLLTFNPGASHACRGTGGDRLGYRCLNIDREIILEAACDPGRIGDAPYFRRPVVRDQDLAVLFRRLHTAIMAAGAILERQEWFLLFMRDLVRDYADPAGPGRPEEADAVQVACAYLAGHYAERISLDGLAELTGMNKYTLLREFARRKGITPYRYVETLRIARAKKLLERGVAPAEAALQAGFSDQSHFTRHFRRYIGLSPGQYRSVFRGEK